MHWESGFAIKYIVDKDIVNKEDTEDEVDTEDKKEDNWIPIEKL